MIKEAKNKDMAAAPASKQQQQEFFFSGGMEFQPITILATSQAEADEKWKEQRVPITQ